ncbi:MAG: hypothetical protein Hyperionvirus19_7 [Hyperionvirus sp.]|uniref:Holliday junction resolvase n=1 Tax=Hyperionvirus sp. TaxID=2487770 RepID=A0A3G5AE79_9VIRU|nr:MAG: hypothetical protein Hyperionvirus19_7 [Hyperionvirus sp.]
MGRMYLSWDVGIINLAYCLIEKIDDMHFKIRKWGTISLQDPSKICEETTRGNKKCTNKALFILNTDVEHYYCKTHAKKHKPDPPEQLPCTDKERCCHQIHESPDTHHNCGKKATATIKTENIPYCKSHLSSHIKTLTTQLSPQKIHKSNANKIPLQILSIKLFTYLDQIPEFTKADEILIENQPTLKNPTMKSISTLLFSYFTIRGIIDKPIETNKDILNVKFICPSNKLKVSDSAATKLKKLKEDGADERKVYEITKTMGMTFCRELIKSDKQQLEFIDKQKKKDDLCDAFLQGYYYIFCRQGVPKEICNILNKLCDTPVAQINAQML